MQIQTVKAIDLDKSLINQLYPLTREDGWLRSLLNNITGLDDDFMRPLDPIQAVIMLDPEPIGWATVAPGLITYPGQDWPTFISEVNVFVSPDFRGCGIGDQLLQFVHQNFIGPKFGWPYCPGDSGEKLFKRNGIEIFDKKFRYETPW